MKAPGEPGGCAVIAGKSLLACTRGEASEAPVASTCVAFVQTDDPKPKRRLFDVLPSHGHQLNQPITVLSDGGDPVRDLQRSLNPQAAHRLAWFHLTRRLTGLPQTAKGLPQTTQDDEGTSEIRAPGRRLLERLPWFLWHGNGSQAVPVVPSVAMAREVAVVTSHDGTARKLLKAVEEFPTDLRNHAGVMPNDGERDHHGERLGTGVVESPVTHVVRQRRVKKQQRPWTPRGAPLLLQIRTHVLNDAWEATFRTWSPGFRSHTRRVAA